MSKLFSRVCLTTDSGSTDEYLCPGMPDTEEQITETDGYRDFLEDNPDAESVTVAKAKTPMRMISRNLKSAVRIFSTAMKWIIWTITGSSSRLAARAFLWRK